MAFGNELTCLEHVHKIVAFNFYLVHLTHADMQDIARYTECSYHDGLRTHHFDDHDANFELFSRHGVCFDDS